MKYSKQSVLFLIVLAGLLACSYFTVFSKANSRRALMQSQLDTRQRSLDELQRNTGGMNDVRQSITEIQNAVSFFESKLPQQKEMDKILKEVWQMAEANSLQTKTIQPLASKRAAHYSEQPIELSLTGNFNGFYAFLLQLEKLPRLTRVTKMELVRAADHDGDMQVKITLSIYFEPEVFQVSDARSING